MRHTCTLAAATIRCMTEHQGVFPASGASRAGRWETRHHPHCASRCRVLHQNSRRWSQGRNQQTQGPIESGQPLEGIDSPPSAALNRGYGHRGGVQWIRSGISSWRSSYARLLFCQWGHAWLRHQQTRSPRDERPPGPRRRVRATVSCG